VLLKQARKNQVEREQKQKQAQPMVQEAKRAAAPASAAK
jgi:hypothetical protein